MNDAYYGGLFDGEGNVAVYKTVEGYQLRVRITMVNKAVLQSFQDRFDGSLKPYKGKVNKRTGSTKARDFWVWHPNGSKVEFLKTIQSHTIEKRPQIDLAIQYIGRFGEGAGGGVKRTAADKSCQHWYYEEFKRLKKV